MVKRLVQVGLIVTHCGHGKRRLLPQVVIFDFRNGDVELVPHPVFQAADRMPLVLERTAFRHMKFDSAYSDKHIYYVKTLNSNIETPNKLNVRKKSSRPFEFPILILS